MDYAIPLELKESVALGDRVVVLLRKRRAVGTILELMDHSEVPGIRPIEGLVGGDTTVTPAMMSLARWMAPRSRAPSRRAIAALAASIWIATRSTASFSA